MEPPPKGEKSWLEGRKRIEKVFIVTFFIMVIVIVLLIIGVSCQYSGSCSTLEKQELCLTPKCVETATNILSSLDKNVKPCHDFYRFACGNTIKKTEIASDKSYVDRFDTINEEITEQLHTILKEPIEKNEIKPIALVKKYFQACMNEDLIEKQGAKVITDLFEELGGWPVLDGDSWNEKQFQWTELIYKFRKLGLDTTIFIELTVDPDPTDSSVRIAELDQAHFGLSREYLITHKHTDTYLDLMVNISVQLGANRTRAEEELQESLDFEIQLANISLPSEKRRNITELVTHMSINELQRKYPKTPWLEYLNNLLLTEIPLRGDDIILVVVPSYFSSFEKLLEETPKRVQANYALWRAVQEVISLLPKDVYQHILNALRIINGQAKRPDRWNECTQSATSKLPFLVSSLYIRKYFDEDAKKNALEMVGYLKNTFMDILKKLEWMDKVTRQKALDKADKIAEHIGYPDELLNDTLLEKHYNKLEIHADQYLKSFLNIQHHQNNYKYNRLHQPVDKSDWTEHGDTATVGASYIPLENSIYFPAGILQGIFFNKDRPRYLNFGAIGSIIGHEITHGFDDTGRQFDGNGNLVNWWESKTEQSFLNKTQCMIYQYGNYTVPEINTNINGIRTQGENIADNGGLKEAYLAYQSWVKDNKPEQKLPGLEYSPEQLFWISAAMNWCTSYKPAYLKNVVATDSHSPNEFRVLGPFSNSEQFAKDFNCKSGSRMNPIDKCAVW